jgi:hypothetical protein
MKRAQSARRSSETYSPRGWDAGPGALSGCCSGSRNHSPVAVETVGNSCLCEARALPLRALGGDVASRLYAAAPSPPTPKRSAKPDPTGGAVEVSVHDDWWKPGPGVSACRLTPAAFGEGLPLPRLYLIVGRVTDRIKVSPPAAPNHLSSGHPRIFGRCFSRHCCLHSRATILVLETDLAVADTRAMRLRPHRQKRHLTEQLALAAAFSLALFAWGLREITHAL